MTSGSQIWVETPFSEIESGEDEETNPGVYGRAFTHWLADRLKARGESVDQIVAEDWSSPQFAVEAKLVDEINEKFDHLNRAYVGNSHGSFDLRTSARAWRPSNRMVWRGRNTTRSFGWFVRCISS
jgi:hypothetical protein